MSKHLNNLEAIHHFLDVAVEGAQGTLLHPEVDCALLAQNDTQKNHECQDDGGDREQDGT